MQADYMRPVFWGKQVELHFQGNRPENVVAIINIKHKKLLCI